MTNATTIPLCVGDTVKCGMNTAEVTLIVGGWKSASEAQSGKIVNLRIGSTVLDHVHVECVDGVWQAAEPAAYH